MVTMENAEEYVELMFDFCMHTGIQKQMEAFRGACVRYALRIMDILPQIYFNLFIMMWLLFIHPPNPQRALTGSSPWRSWALSVIRRCRWSCVETSLHLGRPRTWWTTLNPNWATRETGMSWANWVGPGWSSHKDRWNLIALTLSMLHVRESCLSVRSDSSWFVERTVVWQLRKWRPGPTGGLIYF